MDIHQFVSGYKAGHKILATSCRDTISKDPDISPQSDRWDHINYHREDQSYWHGYPSRRGNFYVLQRTWLAPEMSRPGCVWTHGFILPLELFTKPFNMQVFQMLSKRPIITSYFIDGKNNPQYDSLGLGHYRKPIPYQEEWEQYEQGWNEKVQADYGEFISEVEESFKTKDCNLIKVAEPELHYPSVIMRAWGMLDPQTRVNTEFVTGVFWEPSIREAVKENKFRFLTVLE